MRRLSPSLARALPAALGLVCAVASSHVEPCEESTQALEWDEPGRSGRTPMDLLARAQAQDSLQLRWDGSGIYGDANLGLSRPDTTLVVDVSAEEEGGRDMERSGDCGRDGDGVETQVSVHVESADGAIYFTAPGTLAEDDLADDALVLHVEIEDLPALDLSEIEPAGARLVDVRLELRYADDASAGGRLMGRVEDGDGTWFDDVQVASVSSP